MHFNQKLPLSQPEDAFTVGTSPPNVTVHRCCQRQHVSSGKVASLSIPGRFLIPQGRGTITPALPYFANVKVAVIVALDAFSVEAKAAAELTKVEVVVQPILDDQLVGTNGPQPAVQANPSLAFARY